MLEVKKRRPGTRTWLSRTIQGCQDFLAKHFETLSQMSHNLVLDNLQRRLSTWEEADRLSIIDKDQLEEEINASA